MQLVNLMLSASLQSLICLEVTFLLSDGQFIVATSIFILGETLALVLLTSNPANFTTDGDA